MNKVFCKHTNCKYFYNLNKNEFCEYHQAELDNNGKPGFVTCSWCTNYREGLETMAQENFSNVL